MAEALYMTDSYLKEFEATVLSVDGKFVVLDRTAFYPRGGGQQHDTGKLIRDGEEFNVVFCGKFNGEISHEVDKEGLKKGDVVKGIIDWDRRYKLMRMHTMAHILSSVLYEDHKVLITGNELGVDKTRIDYSLENYDIETLKKSIDKANDIIRKGAKVTVSFKPREEALKIPAITKLHGASLPDVPELRLVDIEGVDLQADGGTHVKDIKEVGTIEFLKAENKGKGRRRVYVTLS